MKLDKESLLNFGEAVHTALRKICDSPWTSIAYNAIGELSNEEWDDYIVYMQNILDRHFANRIILIQTVANYSKEYFRHKYNISGLLMILKVCFENFNLDEWEGYSTYLEFKKKRNKK